MVSPLIRSVGTGLLAGVSGATFAGLAAGLLHVSVIIASTVAGVLLAVVVGFFTYRYPRVPFNEHLTIDDVGITRTARDLREHVAWVDIARVRIITTDQGPWHEDVCFVVDSKNGDGCAVTHDLAVRSGLLAALQSRLEGVNNAAVIAAMASNESRVVTIWEAKGAPT